MKFSSYFNREVSKIGRSWRGTGRADRGLGRRWVGLYLAQPRAIMKETYEWQQ